MPPLAHARTRRRTLVSITRFSAAFALLLGAAQTHAFDDRWSRQTEPAPGLPEAIGGTSNGCLVGADSLPPGTSWRILHPERHRTFGHPVLIAFIRRFATALRARHRPPLGVGDLAQPRGGPTPSGHRSHQTGLDVDLAYVVKQGVAMPVVDLTRGTLTRAWRSAVADLIKTAALDPDVDRIFVNPAIKQALCAAMGNDPNADWLHRVRPWWAHHDHFHVRLRCPGESLACQSQDPLPPGRGCDASLAWWFSADAQATEDRRQQVPAPPVPMPPACAALVPSTPVPPIRTKAPDAGTGPQPYTDADAGARATAN